MSRLTVWRTFRALRWLLWLAFFAYCLEFVINRESHINQFGHLVLTTETLMFGLLLAAVYIGFFEMMAREWAGVARNLPSKSDYRAQT